MLSQLKPPTTERPHLDVIIPCYNEEEVLPTLRERLTSALDTLDVHWNVIFIDDGSRDSTLPQLIRMHHEEPRFKVISFSRNFGHQPAVMAGICHSEGDVVAVLDADLQDPPELLAKCLEHWREGYDVVYAVRQKRKEGFLKRLAYTAFYRGMRAVADIDIPLDSGDFCLMDRKVVATLKALPERSVFVRGLRAWSGFKQIGMPYDRPERAAGQTKYPFKRLVKLALDGIVSFSTMPLRIANWVGMLLVALCFVGSIFVLLWRLFPLHIFGRSPMDVPGWTTGILLMLFLHGIELLILGVIGEYQARIYDEVKGRPRYVCQLRLGIEEGAPVETARNVRRAGVTSRAKDYPQPEARV